MKYGITLKEFQALEKELQDRVRDIILEAIQNNEYICIVFEEPEPYCITTSKRQKSGPHKYVDPLDVFNELEFSNSSIEKCSFIL